MYFYRRQYRQVFYTTPNQNEYNVQLYYNTSRNDLSEFLMFNLVRHKTDFLKC